MEETLGHHHLCLRRHAGVRAPPAHISRGGRRGRWSGSGGGGGGACGVGCGGVPDGGAEPGSGGFCDGGAMGVGCDWERVGFDGGEEV